MPSFVLLNQNTTEIKEKQQQQEENKTPPKCEQKGLAL